MSRGISEGCFFARWAFANTDPADVTVFEISDDTATITMQVRRAFDPRNALFLLPAVGYLRPRDRVEVHWSPPEDALTSIWITIGPPGDRKAIIDMRSIGDEPGVYRGTVEVYGALPFTEEPHLRADREPVSLVAACEGVSSCIHSSVSEAVLPAVEVRN